MLHSDAASENSVSAPLQALAVLREVADHQWRFQQEWHTMLCVANGYDLERIIEFAVPKPLLDVHLARYRFALPHVGGKRILDMACGTGYGTQLLLVKGGAAEALGADIDPDAIRYAQMSYQQDALRYQQADACHLWTDEVFDVVVSFETIEHIPFPDRFLEAVVGMSRPQGKLIISTPLRLGGSLKDRPAYPYHTREWNLTEFTDLLRQFYDTVELYGQQWRPNLSSSFVRIPYRLRYWRARLQGHSALSIHQLASEVRPLDAAPLGLMQKSPLCVVALCSGPHAAADPARVQELAYGI